MEDGKQASVYDRRVHPDCLTRGPAAFAPAVRDPQERRAGGRGGDQVGNPLLRGAPIPVRFLCTQGTLQLRADSSDASGISQGTGTAQDYEELPADSLQQAAAGGSRSQDRRVPPPACARTQRRRLLVRM